KSGHLADSLNTIEAYAFYGCTSLTNIEIPDSTTVIKGSAFYNCVGLTSITLPEGLEEVSEDCFYGCTGLISITIPEGVSSIQAEAFKDCTGLTSVSITGSNTYVVSGAFEGCTGLKSVYCAKGSFADNESLYPEGTDLSYFSTPTSGSCGENMTYLFDETTGTLTISGSGEMDEYTENLENLPPWYNFRDQITGIVFEDTVTDIGSYAFKDLTALESVIIPKNITSGGSKAFYQCSGLKSVEIKSSYSGIYMFEDCDSLETAVIDEGMEATATGLFEYCDSLKNVSLPESLKTIKEHTFDGCDALETITLPSGLDSIETYAFYGCTALNSVTILGQETSIMDSSTFTNCSALKYVYCYAGAKADDINLYPEGVTIIHLGEETKAEPVKFTVRGIFGGRSVTLTSETEGAVIYYSSTSSSLTTDDACVSNGTTLYFENFYGTIYTRAYYNGVWSDVSKFVLKIPVVNTPTVTASGSTVTIKSTTPSSFICYTTDGSEPVVETDGTLTNGTWLRVNGARTNNGTITASPGDTVRAVAVRNCFTTSASAAAYVNVSPAAFKVVGTFGGRNVTFTSDTSGAKIYYSSTTSSLTTDDKCVSNGETVLFEDFYGTIYARAYYNGKWSNVSRLILKIPTINDPTITYSGGKATIRTTTPNCYIYYTTDGTTPSITNGKKLCSNSYGQVTVSSGTTIKAIAVRSCFTNSTVVSYTVS
ncbi:MAG: leucine-rich repeat protein, partial [Eubacterium sp.]|nr:leucine-rich repeat protein [Eubacterium sp.]